MGLLNIHLSSYLFSFGCFVWFIWWILKNIWKELVGSAGFVLIYRLGYFKWNNVRGISILDVKNLNMIFIWDRSK